MSCQYLINVLFLCLKSVTGGSDGKESAFHAADLGLISGLGRSPGGGHVNWCSHCAKQHGGFSKPKNRGTQQFHYLYISPQNKNTTNL